MKQVIVVRTDLDMGKGKLAGQVAHASHLLTDEILNCIDTSPPYPAPERYHWYYEWMEKDFYKKIVLKVDSEAQLRNIYEEAKKIGKGIIEDPLRHDTKLPVVMVFDKGLTQIPPNTPTCVGIGPAPDELIDQITKGLKLL